MTEIQTTPLRSTYGLGGGQVVRLRSTELDYLDGGEQAVLGILRSSNDLSSLSDELAVKGDTWAETYHLAAARANVLRGLRLGADDVVLEIGAGCGAITRYLGETCGIVDALEPVGSRALAARERVRDLPGVEVFVGELADVPAVESYDVVVVVGVLEYIGFGDPARAPYVEFLGQISRLLRPGGSLVLAIENQLGVKYLVGAPEDHTDRAFDSLEGYPHGGRARTFSRSALVSLIEGVGLSPRFLSAFPDYKMTRAVFDPERLTGEPSSLQYRIPAFPSPDWGTPRLPLADEKNAWRTLVEAGLAAQTPNSFVVVAGKGGPSSLWGPDDAAVYYSSSRLSRYAVETRLEGTGDAPVFRRRHLSPEGERGGVWLDVRDAPFVPGSDLSEVFVDTDDVESASLLTAWRDLLLASGGPDAAVRLDLVPHNLVVSPDGSLVFIDDEWQSTSHSVQDVLRRGVLTFALRLAAAGDLRGRWDWCETVGDIALRLGASVGLEGREWIDDAVQVESELQALVAPSRSAMPRVDNAAALRVSLARSIRKPEARVDPQLVLRLGLMESERLETDAFIQHLHADIGELKLAIESLLAAADRHRLELDSARAELGQAAARHNESLSSLRADHATTVAGLSAAAERWADESASLAAELDAVHATFSWRVTRPLRAVRRRRD